jgi:hypothetical protein
LYTKKSKTKLKHTLQTVDIIITKIAAVPSTKHSTVAVVTNKLAATVKLLTDLRDATMFAKKKTANYRNI